MKYYKLEKAVMAKDYVTVMKLLRKKLKLIYYRNAFVLVRIACDGRIDLLKQLRSMGVDLHCNYENVLEIHTNLDKNT